MCDARAPDVLQKMHQHAELWLERLHPVLERLHASQLMRFSKIQCQRHRFFLSIKLQMRPHDVAHLIASQKIHKGSDIYSL